MQRSAERYDMLVHDTGSAGGCYSPQHSSTVGSNDQWDSCRMRRPSAPVESAHSAPDLCVFRQQSRVFVAARGTHFELRSDHLI